MMIEDIVESSFTISTDMPLAAVENLYIHHVIYRCKGNITKAAIVLGIDRRTLYRKIERMKND